MKKRTTKVNSLLIDSEYSSTVLAIGDTFKASPLSLTIAVQKKFPVFFEDPFDFHEFSLFKQEIPIPSPTLVDQKHIHHDSTIDVQSIHVLGVASASQINIGSLDHLFSEARVKHTRIYY
ncbi:spore germination protein GerPE [Bacillaceae bacterium S4-13-58]